MSIRVELGSAADSPLIPELCRWGKGYRLEEQAANGGTLRRMVGAAPARTSAAGEPLGGQPAPEGIVLLLAMSASMPRRFFRGGAAAADLEVVVMTDTGGAGGGLVEHGVGVAGSR